MFELIFVIPLLPLVSVMRISLDCELVVTERMPGSVSLLTYSNRFRFWDHHFR